MLRPVFDYACVVYSSMINGRQSALLEQQQRKILKVIYGRKTSYSRCLEKAGIEKLSERRETLCRNFAIKLSASHAFKEWFPKNVTDNPERHFKKSERV